MKTLAILLSAAAAATVAPAASAYPHHGYYRGPVYVAPYYPRYAYPYWYFAPFVAGPYYAAPYYVTPPVVIERRYAVPLPPAPREPQYREGERTERSQAQIAPQAKIEPPRKAEPSRLERYTLSATELFEFDKSTLRMPQPKLDEIADALSRNQGIDHVTITGYTDRLGSNEYNLKLSQRRADAVKRYLASKGVDAKRLVAVGKGEANPVVHCDDKDRAKLIQCLEPNRRVEVERITVEVRERI